MLMGLCGCGSSGSGSQAASSRAHRAALLSTGQPTISTPGASTPAAIPSAQTARGRPNIVFILTDDLAWNLVRYMPHVLGMERRGEMFSNYYVTDSLCCPSRASILTGRFPHDTHVTSNSPPYGGFQVFHSRGEERYTFATALQRRGYETALMGKYLNGYQPEGNEGGVTPGGTEIGSKPYIPLGWNEWDVAGDGYPEFNYTLNSDGRPVKYGSEPQDYLTDVLARKGLSFIERAATRRKPFMLEIAPFAPHAPFTPAPRDEQDFPGLRAPRTPAFDVPTIGAPAWLSHFTELEPTQIEQLDHQFRKRAQAVQAVDNMIAEIEAKLAARGLAQNTYLMFSSDNGLHMGEHRLTAGKQTAFDTDIRVPLIVVGPGVPAGRTVGALAENIDLCPTFERLGGAKVGPNVDGHSLTRLLHGQPAVNWRQEILVEHHGPVLDAGDPDLPTRGAGNPPSYEALRTQTSLYVEYITGEREYYNLRTDPFELHNLAVHLSPARMRVLHRALARLEACRGAKQCWRAEHGKT
jgi:N-acetylglucosamine-6-sulfatase